MAMKPRAMKKKTPMRGGGMAKPKAKMMRGGAATKKKTMARGGALKPAPNKGAASLPKTVRNKMGFMKRGGVAKK